MLAACDAGAPLQQPPASAPTIASAPPSDASVHVIDFDPDLVIRPAVRGPAAVAPVPGGTPPKLVVRQEQPHFGEHGGDAADQPPWLPSYLGSFDVVQFHAEPDGMSTAIAGNTVILIGRDHRAEVGLDIGAFQSANVIDAHRVGQIVIALCVDSDPEQRTFLAAIDAVTGRSLWSHPTGAAGEEGPPNFVVIGGFAVMDGAELVVRELATGLIVSHVATSAATHYTLELRPDGSLHGEERALVQADYKNEIDIDVARDPK